MAMKDLILKPGEREQWEIQRLKGLVKDGIRYIEEARLVFQDMKAGHWSKEKMRQQARASYGRCITGRISLQNGLEFGDQPRHSYRLDALLGSAEHVG